MRTDRAITSMSSDQVAMRPIVNRITSLAVGNYSFSHLWFILTISFPSEACNFMQIPAIRWAILVTFLFMTQPARGGYATYSPFMTQPRGCCGVVTYLWKEFPPIIAVSWWGQFICFSINEQHDLREKMTIYIDWADSSNTFCNFCWMAFADSVSM